MRVEGGMVAVGRGEAMPTAQPAGLHDWNPNPGGCKGFGFRV